MELIITQLYDFGVGFGLGCVLSLFYLCYRHQFHGRHYSQRTLLLTDSLWWVFAVIFTVGCLFWLQWGALRILFFVAFLLGFLLGYFGLWGPIGKKIRIVFMKKPPASLPKKAAKKENPYGAKKTAEKKESWLEKPFYVTAKNLYKGFSYGKGQYLTVKKKKIAAEEKWKKQVQAEKLKVKQKFLAVFWPKEKDPHIPPEQDWEEPEEKTEE